MLKAKTCLNDERSFYASLQTSMRIHDLCAVKIMGMRQGETRRGPTLQAKARQGKARMPKEELRTPCTLRSKVAPCKSQKRQREGCIEC
jgi:hypothetical protein